MQQSITLNHVMLRLLWDTTALSAQSQMDRPSHTGAYRAPNESVQQQSSIFQAAPEAVRSVILLMREKFHDYGLVLTVHVASVAMVA